MDAVHHLFQSIFAPTPYYSIENHYQMGGGLVMG